MFTVQLRCVGCCVLALAFGSMDARGEVATLEFAGEVIRVDDNTGLLGGRVALGTPVSASVRYDLATPDFYPEDSTRGAYLAPGWLMLDVGGLRFERTTWVQVDVLHYFQDQEYFSAMANNEMTAWPTPTEATDFNQILIQFWQYPPTYSMFASDSLPASVDFSRANYSHSFVSQSSSMGGPRYDIYFNLVQVPEPGTGALLGLGLVALCWRAGRR